MGCIAVHGRLGRAALLIIEGRTLLAAHLPHTDRERVAFLTEVAEEVEKAATAHSQ